MKKFIMTILMTLMIAATAMARPITKAVYVGENADVFLSYDTDTYGKDFAKDADMNAVYGELKAHEDYFIWNINDKKFEIGSAKGMDLWMDTFGDLLKYADEKVKEGYAIACLICAADGLKDDSLIEGFLMVTNSGLICGYWEYDWHDAWTK